MKEDVCTIRFLLNLLPSNCTVQKRNPAYHKCFMSLSVLRHLMPIFGQQEIFHQSWFLLMHQQWIWHHHLKCL